MRANRELPPLLLRADASASQGAGHVMRCLALGAAWRERGGRVGFVTCRPSPALCQRIKLTGDFPIDIDNPHPALEDCERTVAALESLAQQSATPPWLVLDGYHFDHAYQSALRGAGCRLLVLDDNAHLPRYDADIVLNHGIHAPRLEYSACSDAWLLLGTRYAVLRAEFESWRALVRSQPESARKILVTLGGGDYDNVTVKVIQALRCFGHTEIEAQVIVGPLHPRIDELRRLVAAHSNIHLQTDVTDMAPLMAWADVAIAAGGTTAWELAFMQTPALLLVLAENQAAVAAGIDEFGAARSLGWARALSSAALADGLRELLRDDGLRAHMARRGRMMVDGLGVARVLDAMAERQQFVGGDGAWLRPATSADSLLLWQWANDPPTRRDSFNSAKISWREHEDWLRDKLASTASRMWIMQIGNLPVGQIRYDRIESCEGRSAEVSFTIAAGFRGIGLGTRLLEMTAELAARELGVRWIKGISFIGNQASRRAFLRAGFEAVEQCIVGARECAVFRRAAGASSRSEYLVPLH
jgi:UDP-2,4-diacetamido-2,4,6-trideoxy-beta-L-altropyranose hydrolase